MGEKKKSLKKEIDRLERISSQLSMTQQQIEMFQMETNSSLEKMKDANWSFTKEVCVALGKVKSPHPVMADVADKFMQMLEQRERSWAVFRSLTQN